MVNDGTVYQPKIISEELRYLSVDITFDDSQNA